MLEALTVTDEESGDAPVFEPPVTIAGAPRLTKATWRQSGRRKLYRRINNWGGVTVASPAFLEAAKRTQFKPGRPGHRVCNATQKNGKPCTRLAMHGMKVCESHGGAEILARQGRLQKSGRAAAAIAAKEAAKAAEMRSKMPEGRPSDVPPLELTRLRVYIEANEWTRLRLIRAWGAEGWHGLVQQLLSRDDPRPGDDRDYF
jgi:hypothetical protein